MRTRQIAAVLTMAVSATAVLPMMTQAADNNDSYRRRVVGIAGIIKNVSTNLTESVTRGYFAEMLVNASTYSDYLPVTSNVSVYSDVPATHEYASSIRIAAEQGWMVGYLGGLFKPDQPITLQEAARGILGLLGYTNDDFTGNTSYSRMALFYSLELNDNMNREPEEILTKNDCVDLFYNLLKTDNKNGVAYATVIGATLNSDGEVNPFELADTDLVGPKLIPKGHLLGNYIPFNVQEASIFIDGEASSYDILKQHVSNDYVVVYYNQTAKTIWAYIADSVTEIQEGRCAIRGTVENIYYSSTDVMTPTSIYLSGDDVEYTLGNTEMQFAFSVYGSLRVGDIVTLICEKTVNSNGDETYSIIDYVED
ncbi:MAG: S-layer homology domain-containing protein [Clostridiales bacterium]|nr:S-layer homology domain-containing protein [Clostridiales bacterium]